MLKNYIDKAVAKPLFSHDGNILLKEISIFGAGQCGRNFKKLWEQKGGSVKYFFDNNQEVWGKKIDRCPIVSPEKIEDIDHHLVICSIGRNSILAQLSKINPEKIYMYHYYGQYIDLNQKKFFENHMNECQEVFSLLADESSKKTYASVIKSRMEGDCTYLDLSKFSQYEHPAVCAISGDIIINGGAYTGDTDLMFHKAAKNCKIHSFEPTEDLYEQLKQTISSLPEGSSTLIKKGLWSKKNQLKFQLNDSASRIVLNDNDFDQKKITTIDVVSIDEYCEELGLVPTLIKMDIEGAEPEALEGAIRVITEHRPKLQICIYHNPEHYYSIPLRLKELTPDYDYYIGQHAIIPSETVFYALPK